MRDFYCVDESVHLIEYAPLNPYDDDWIIALLNKSVEAAKTCGENSSPALQELDLVVSDLMKRTNSADFEGIEASIADYTAYLLAGRLRQSNDTNPKPFIKNETTFGLKTNGCE